jgi:hypothetical protein
MREYNGLRLTDVGTPRLTWRLLGVLVRHLSPQSATYRAIHPEHVGWSTTEYLLADIIDVLIAGNWQRGNAGAAKGQASPKPAPSYRPRPPGTPAPKSLDDRVRDWQARHCRERGND